MRPTARAATGRAATGRVWPSWRVRLGGYELAILGVRQVLVGGAVAVVRQRGTLAGRAFARRRTALGRRAADGGVALVRMFEQELLGIAHVAVDHRVDMS